MVVGRQGGCLCSLPSNEMKEENAQTRGITVP